MNLRDAQIVLRTRTAGEVLDLAFRVHAAQGVANLRLGGLLFVPAWLLLLGAHRFGGVGWAWIWGLALLWAIIAQGALTVALGERMFARAAAVRGALLGLWRRFGSYLGALVVTGVLIGVVSFTVILPVLVWPRLLFMREAMLLESAPVGAALSRSMKLITRRVGTVYVLWLAIVIAPIGGAIIAELLGQAIVTNVLAFGKPFGDLFEDGGSAFALLGFFAAIPWVATARFLGYLDLRTQKEGWDIQVRFAALAKPTPVTQDRAA